MKRELIEYEPGVLVDLTSESLDDLHVVSDHCQRLRSCGLTGAKEMKLLAILPGFMIEKYCNDQGITYAEFMRNPDIQTRMLNDPSLAAFRVTEGKV